MYYTYKEYYERKFHSVEREYAFLANTQEEHQIWREATRKRLMELTGMDQCMKVDAQAECKRSTQMDGYVE